MTDKYFPRNNLLSDLEIYKEEKSNRYIQTFDSLVLMQFDTYEKQYFEIQVNKNSFTRQLGYYGDNKICWTHFDTKGRITKEEFIKGKKIAKIKYDSSVQNTQTYTITNDKFVYPIGVITYFDTSGVAIQTIDTYREFSFSLEKVLALLKEKNINRQRCNIEGRVEKRPIWIITYKNRKNYPGYLVVNGKNGVIEKKYRAY